MASLTCDAQGCIRGVVRGRSAFGDPCVVCKGLGSISLGVLAKRIGENESTVRKIEKLHRKMRVKVTARICAKIMDLVAPPPPKLPKQPELFT